MRKEGPKAGLSPPPPPTYCIMWSMVEMCVINRDMSVAGEAGKKLVVVILAGQEPGLGVCAGGGGGVRCLLFSLICLLRPGTVLSH